MRIISLLSVVLLAGCATQRPHVVDYPVPSLPRDATVMTEMQKSEIELTVNEPTALQGSTVTLSWTWSPEPAPSPNNELWCNFKLYSSESLSVPLKKWQVRMYLTGWMRSVTLSHNEHPHEFFYMTTTNILTGVESPL